MTESEAVKELQDNVDLPFGSNVSADGQTVRAKTLIKNINVG